MSNAGSGRESPDVAAVAAMARARALPLFQAEAKARQVASGREVGRGREKVLANLPGPIGPARDAAAAGSSVSARTIQHAANVIARATPEVVRAVDSGKLAVSAAAERTEGRCK